MSALMPYEPNHLGVSYPTNRAGKRINAFIRSSQARQFAFVPIVSQVPTNGTEPPSSFFQTSNTLWSYQLSGGNPNRLGVCFLNGISQ